MGQTTIAFRISDEEKELVAEYAKAHNFSLTDLYRTTVLNKIKDELDLQVLRKVIEEAKGDKGISQGEMEQLLHDI